MQASNIFIAAHDQQHSLQFNVRYGLRAASAASIVSATPPPLPAGSLYYETVEARLEEGLHFQGGNQTVRFGDSPQVRAHIAAGNRACQVCPSAEASKCLIPLRFAA